MFPFRGFRFFCFQFVSFASFENLQALIFSTLQYLYLFLEHLKSLYTHILNNEVSIIASNKEKRVEFTCKNIREGAPSHRTFSTSPSSNTSIMFLCLLQLLIEALGGMIIGIGILQPLIKGAVVVHLRFLLAKRIGLVVTNNPIAILATTFTFQNLKFFS